MSDNSQEEKRRFSRASFDGEASLQCGEMHFAVQMADLSIKGAKVLLPGDIDLSPKTEAVLTLVLDDTDITITLPCIVSHQSGGRAGLEFQQVEMESAQHLRRLVELNMDGEDPLVHFTD